MNKRSLCWNITPRCNSYCKFCYRNLKKREIELSENMGIINIISKLKIEKITFSGGECLLYPNLIDLLKKCHKLNIKTSVITKVNY